MTKLKMPKLLNIKKYVAKHCPESATYANTFKGNIDSGIFLFDETDAELWAGPWGTSGVIMLLDDNSNSSHLEDGCETAGYPSVKMPFRLFLAGTDDTSYSKVFSELHEMAECANEIIKTPTEKNLFELGFVFTN